MVLCYSALVSYLLFVTGIAGWKFSSSTTRASITTPKYFSKVSRLIVAAGLVLVAPSMPTPLSSNVIVRAAHAADKISMFQGSYSDPFHVGCMRQISIVDGDKIKIVGSDDVDGKNQWVIYAKESPEAGKMLVDFSPKGGPSDLLGVFDAKDNSIHWPDGNAWKKL